LFCFLYSDNNTNTTNNTSNISNAILNDTNNTANITTTALTTLQRNLLFNGYKLLKPGGMLIYSTCSNEVSQNEEVLRWLSKECLDVIILPVFDFPVVCNDVVLINTTNNANNTINTNNTKSDTKYANILTPHTLLNLPTLSEIANYAYKLTSDELIFLSTEICGYFSTLDRPIFEHGGLEGTVKLGFRGGMSGHFIAKIQKPF
jgi:hypothetical protein